jgi:hypothetical protein
MPARIRAKLGNCECSCLNNNMYEGIDVEVVNAISEIGSNYYLVNRDRKFIV